jgi:hypothetical protein
MRGRWHLHDGLEEEEGDPVYLDLKFHTFGKLES